MPATFYFPPTAPGAHNFRTGDALHHLLPSTPATRCPTWGGNVSAALRTAPSTSVNGRLHRQQPTLPLPANRLATWWYSNQNRWRRICRLSGHRTAFSVHCRGHRFHRQAADVYPSADFPAGFDMNLTDAIMRMPSYCNSRHERALSNPGEA